MSAAKQRKLSFKAGFLAKLARDGVLPSKLFERVKSAGLDLTAAPGFLYGEARDLTGLLASQAVPAAKFLATIGTLTPIGLGAATGTMAAKLNAPPEPDIEAIRKEEMIQLYRRLAHEIRARRRMPGV